MAISGFMVFTDDDFLYDGMVFENKLDCQKHVDSIRIIQPLVRVVEVEIHPKEEVIRFYDG